MKKSFWKGMLQDERNVKKNKRKKIKDPSLKLKGKEDRNVMKSEHYV